MQIIKEVLGAVLGVVNIFFIVFAIHELCWSFKYQKEKNERYEKLPLESHFFVNDEGHFIHAKLKPPKDENQFVKMMKVIAVAGGFLFFVNIGFCSALLGK